jgi:hypothetical protein
MSKYIATVIDTTGIQPYIFGSNRLRENIGASYLVAQATNEWVKCALRQRFGENVYIPPTQPEKQIDQDNLDAELVYTGGGNAVLLFKDRDCAVKFTRTLSEKILREAPGLKIVVAHSDPFEWENKLSGTEDRELLRITLLSDLILCDRWGQHVAMPPMQLITGEGEREVEPLTQLLEQLLKVKLQPQSSFVSNLVVGGFNRKWGLPLPQVPALAAGSVFVFKYQGELNIDRIRTLENQGIGERRIDGFGRVAVNWLEEHPEFKAKLPDSKNDLTHQPNLPANTEDSQIAANMAKKLLEQKLDRQLLDKVDRVKLRPNKLSNSQLSRLIIVARQALTEEKKNPVIDLLEKLPNNASGQFEETKVNGKSFKKQVCDWLNEPSTWIDAQHLEVNVAGESVPSNLVEKLKLEYTLRLIMGIAKKSYKGESR